MMMSNKRPQSFVEPLAQSKMARLEGTLGPAAPPGLPKADELPQYSQDKSLPYRQTYISCSLGGQESLEFPPPWSPSRTCVRNGESPVLQHSATEGSITNQLFYRHENVAFPLDSTSPAAVEGLTVKRKPLYCTQSPSKHSPTAAGLSPLTFSNQRHLSPLSAESTVGLAVPKPVYGHGLCCTQRKCLVGQNYGVERGLQRVHSQMPEDDWAAHYDHWVYLQKKEQETLMQQRMVPFEHRGERVPLKEVTTEGYHGHGPSQPRRSAFTETRPSSFPYCPAGPNVPSSSEHCQRFHLPQQAHKAPPTMYDPLTRTHYRTAARAYQERHISRYPEIPQHSLPCYPTTNTQVYRSDHPYLTVEKSAPGSCPIPQPYFSSLTNPYTVVHPSHLTARNLSPYRMQLNMGNVNVYADRPCHSSVSEQVDRPLDFSMRKEQHLYSHREPPKQVGISETFYQEHCKIPDHVPDRNSTFQGVNGFPVSGRHDYLASPKDTGSMFNRKQVEDTTTDHHLHSKGHRLENSDRCDMIYLQRVPEMDQKKTDESPPHPSPPMPVINKVFSLAPYKAYLVAAGMVSLAQDGQSCKVDSKPHHKESEQEHSKAHLGPDRLKVEPVKTPPASNQDSAERSEVKVKKEKTESDEVTWQPEMTSLSPGFSHDYDDVKVKEEPEDTMCDIEHDLVIVKSDFEAECKSPTPKPEPSPECKPEPDAMETVENLPTQTSATKQPDSPAPLPPHPPTPPRTTFSLSQIPAQCLKLSRFEIIVPEMLKAPVPSVRPVLQPPVEAEPAAIDTRQARHQFLELHQSLCKLVSDSVSQTSRRELRSWVSKLDLKAAPPASKTTKVTCLLGQKVRDVWLKGEETLTLLRKVLAQLEHYVRSAVCPFPHVVRAGALFIPMLVVKEILFAQVQGAFIDQVLQEHRVELRPTTLSEERHLTQQHKHTFSSKLRRLLSLKHLPEIYPDVLNLLHYTSVCKFLDSSPTDDVQKVAQAVVRVCWVVWDVCQFPACASNWWKEVVCRLRESCAAAGLELSAALERDSAESWDETSSGADAADPQNLQHPKLSCSPKHRTLGRVKSACRRTFLGEDSSSPDEDNPPPSSPPSSPPPPPPPQEPEHWSWSSSFGRGEWSCSIPVEEDEEDEGHVEVKLEEDDVEEENSWWRPLTSDDFSSDGGDSEAASSSSRRNQRFSKRRSGMVLKLRKVCCGDRRQGPHYRRVTERSESRDGERRQRRRRAEEEEEGSRYGVWRAERRLVSERRRRPERWRNSERRRWALRSDRRGTETRTTSDSYPDLVGKRIRHLYEEKDKTEVWYRGVVLRVHEPHANPLKTVFEVKYDSEPEWQYYLELLLDYQKGWLTIED